MAESYSEVQGGGSLILAWQVKNKKVLVIGGGEVRPTHLYPQLNQSTRTLTLTPKAP